MTKVVRIDKSHLVINIIDLTSKTVIMILPGGGYTLLSNRESAPVGTKFNMFGYNTAILYYTCESYTPYIEGKKALKELSKTFDDIIVVGFSAGGHLAGLLGTTNNHYNLKGMVLCYPVITLLNPLTHEETAQKLLGNDLSIENRQKYSIDYRVNKHTVPTFIWTTKEDELVPYENSLLLVDALNKHKIYHEFVLFPHGRHGLALADETAIVNNDMSFYSIEVSTWIDKANDFIKKILKRG